jgi:hypothetical protein
MALKLGRVSLEAGEGFTAAYSDGCRAVYLVEGAHDTLEYGKPVQVQEGGSIQLNAVTPIVVGVVREEG